ncbi:MAG: ABC transporter ATP-binding protein/permease [Proteobacteria bacterium]|nr:ABC transporter ATP-binding protein/permease [Pseudomonadota bacterium]MBU1716560.1 ABC transporter ATP-binding protein/permease [Pseudomonadota bacterium]
MSFNQLGRYLSAIKLLAPFFYRYKARIILGFLSLLTVDFLQLIIPRIIKQAVDQLEQGSATSTSLLQNGGLIALLAIGIAFFRFSWRYLVLGFSRFLETDLRNLLFAKLLKLDRAFFQKHPPGEIIALASNDLSAVQLASGMGLVAFVDAMVMTAAALAFMAYIHPGLTLIAVFPMPLLALITFLLSALLHKRFKIVQEQFSILTEFARSTVSSIRLVKAYTQEKSQTDRFDAMGQTYIRDNLRLATIQGTLFPFSGLIANVSLLLVIFFGGKLVIKDIISIGDFVAFMTYLYMLTWPMMAMGWVTNLFQRGATSLNRIEDVLQARPKLQDLSTSKGQIEITDNLRINKLNYSYPNHDEDALHDITINITPGLLGIIGKTGSGKTTLCHLLTRLYPVPDQTIYFNDHDVNGLSLAAVRNNIAYVPQDTALFADTIAANISFGKPDAAQSEIEAVAKAVALHKEILSFEHGYQTKLGEKGLTISGGQRQRIALARALILDRPIMIIDDGLSAVDTETENRIINALKPYLAKKICIIVSHRLAPLLQADRIMVMEKGKLTALGTPEQLLAENDYYADIYQHQIAAGECREQ